MNQLTDAIVAHLQECDNVEIKTNIFCDKLTFEGDKAKVLTVHRDDSWNRSISVFKKSKVYFIMIISPTVVCNAVFTR